MSMQMSATGWWVPKEEREIGSPRAGVTGGCMPGMDVGNQTLVICKNGKPS